MEGHSDVMEHLFAEAERFREAVKPYAAGLNCQLRYDNKMSALRAYLIIQSEDDRSAVEDIARKFQHLIGFAHIHQRLPGNCVPAQLERFDFPAYQEQLSRSLLHAIDELVSVEAAEYYSLFILLDPGNRIVKIGASSIAWLSSRRAAMESTQVSDAHAVRFTYFEQWETTFELNGAATNLLIEHQQTISESYSRYGERYLSRMSPAYACWMIEYTARAMSSIAERLETLRKADDFVFFISLYDEPAELQEIAWRRTLPAALLQSVFGPVRDEYQNDA